MANLGLLNKNPGNIKDPSTGQFKVFDSPEEGYQALVSDIEYKKAGKSSHIKPGGSLLDLANVWAPASDKNNPNNWANNVAKSVGTDVNSSWSDIPTDKLAHGIQVAEGTDSMKGVSTSQNGLLQNVFGVPTAHAETTDSSQGALKEDDRSKLDGVVQKMIANNEPEQNIQAVVSDFKQKYGTAQISDSTNNTVTPPPTENAEPKQSVGGLQGLVQGLAHYPLEIASSIASIPGQFMANNNSEEEDARTKERDYGYFGKAKPLNSLSDAAEAGAVTGLETSGITEGAGLLGRVLGFGGSSESALSSPVVSDILGPEAESFSSAEKAKILGNELGNATSEQRPVIERALKELTPQVLKDKGASPGLIKKVLVTLGNHPLSTLISYNSIEPKVAKVVKGIWDKYVGNNIPSVSPNNTTTYDPAP